MALLETPEKNVAFQAVSFDLQGVDGEYYNLEKIKGAKGMLLIFMCNHCPYVKAIINRLNEDIRKLQEIGIGVAAIMPNDTNKYPADSFENMIVFAKEHNFTYPYLIDPSQQTAKNYGAVCTPDIFGFNAEGKLQYRGRVDSAGPNEADVETEREMLMAMKEIAETGLTSSEQFPSMGCSIKWKE